MSQTPHQPMRRAVALVALPGRPRLSGDCRATSGGAKVTAGNGAWIASN